MSLNIGEGETHTQRGINCISSKRGGKTSERLVCTDVTLKSKVPFSSSSSSSSSSSALCSSLWVHDRFSSVFHLPLASKQRPCLSSWLVVGLVSRLGAYHLLFSLHPALIFIFSSLHSVSSPSPRMSLSFSTYLIPSCPHLIAFHFFSFCICALKQSSGVRRGWGERSECDSLLTARRERTKDSKGKGAGIACVYYSSPVLGRSVEMNNTDRLSNWISKHSLQRPQPV